jgi:hypothetical protein
MTGVAYFASVQRRTHHRLVMIEVGHVRAEARLAAVDERHAVEMGRERLRPRPGADRPSRSPEADR